MDADVRHGPRSPVEELFDELNRQTDLESATTSFTSEDVTRVLREDRADLHDK